MALDEAIALYQKLPGGKISSGRKAQLKVRRKSERTRHPCSARSRDLSIHCPNGKNTDGSDHGQRHRGDIVRKDIKKKHAPGSIPTGRADPPLLSPARDGRGRPVCSPSPSWVGSNATAGDSKSRNGAAPGIPGAGEPLFSGLPIPAPHPENGGLYRGGAEGNTYLDLVRPRRPPLEYKERTLNEWYRKQLKQMPPKWHCWSKKMGPEGQFLGRQTDEDKVGLLQHRAETDLAQSGAYQEARLLPGIHPGARDGAPAGTASQIYRFKALMDHYLPNWKHRRRS